MDVPTKCSLIIRKSAIRHDGGLDNSSGNDGGSRDNGGEDDGGDIEDEAGGDEVLVVTMVAV